MMLNDLDAHQSRVFLTAWSPCLDYSITGADFLRETPVSVVDGLHDEPGRAVRRWQGLG